jgi:hypothetical protein
VLSGRGSTRIPQSNKKHNFEPKPKKTVTPRESNKKQTVNQDLELSNIFRDTVVDTRFLMSMKHLEKY